MSGASERANGRASGPVLQSVFLAVFDHSALTGPFAYLLALLIHLHASQRLVCSRPLLIPLLACLLTYIPVLAQNESLDAETGCSDP